MTKRDGMNTNASPALFVDLPPEPSTSTAQPPAARAPVRSFFAVALQIARAFPALVALARALYTGDRLATRREACAIADAIRRRTRPR
jgi:hypothetical protein